MYDARHIANWFVKRAARDGRRLTIMQLLKLTYIAHGWHLEMQHSPLFINKIEAWKFGPVIPDVYYAFRDQGVTVHAPISVQEESIGSRDLHLLEQIYSSYGQLSAEQLSQMTHEQGGPWELATSQWGYFAHIPNDMILSHYREKRSKASA